MNYRITALLFTLSCPLLMADSWSFKPEKVSQEFIFGDTRIVRTVDATEDQQYPEFTIDIFTNGELEAKYKGLSFEHIAASENGVVFTGISNNGLPGNALVVFDAQGNLRVVLDHDRDSHYFHYCARSVTRRREWFDPEDPNLHFVETESGTDIRLNGCEGQELSIMDMMANHLTSHSTQQPPAAGTPDGVP